MSLRVLIKRVFSDWRAVEGAKSIFARVASGQALTLVYQKFRNDLTFKALSLSKKNNPIKNQALWTRSEKVKMLSARGIPNRSPM